jgi:uncharacterized protein
MARLLSWVLDVIVVLLIARAVLRLLFGSRTPAARPDRRAPERLGGTLVRDPQCGTYVPESRAIRVGSGAHALYFCSPDCRDAYAAAEAKGA